MMQKGLTENTKRPQLFKDKCSKRRVVPVPVTQPD